MLQVGNLEAVDPSTAGVKRLGHLTSGSWCTCHAAIATSRLEELMGNDGIGQVLIKISSGDHAERIDVMFDENIDVIRHFGFKAGIAEANKSLILRRAVHGQGLGDVLRIGTREPAAIDKA